MFEELRERIINIFTNRLTILWLAMVGLCAVLIYRCFSLQIIHGQEYLDNFILEQEKTRDIASTRGNIYDRNGNLLAYSELAYSVKIEDTFESGSGKNAKLNSLIYTLIQLVEKNGDDVISSFKIYVDEDNNFQYTVEGTQLLRFLADVYGHASTSELTQEEKNAVPDDVMIYLSRNSGKGYHYAIGEREDPDDKETTFIEGKGYTKKEWLKILTIRYAMSQTAYRKYIGTTVATDISDETVACILENSDILPGISIEEDSVRKYVDSVYFSHLLGYTGKISSDEMAELNEQVVAEGGNADTYTINDVIGKSGIESYLETTLQGTKGYERVMVDTTGKVISVLERQEASAGNDVYLSIDKDLTMAVYQILEQKLAGMIASKIINTKYYIPGNNSKSSDIKIPIYDVYFAVINNNIVDISHLSDPEAGETEAAVYESYLDYKDSVYEKLRNELTTKRTAYNKLDTEYEVYESNIVTLLTKNGVIQSEKVDTEDTTYIAWTTDEVISLGEYLEYCIAQNWIDTTRLSLDEKYSDSSSIFSALVEYIFQAIDGNSEFQKRFFKYMLLNDKISGKQVCLLLYEQDSIEIPFDEVEALKNGKMTAYTFMMNRVTNIDITPAQLALDPCNASVVITDVNNGQVLALVSYPGYDNNKMANSIDADYYAKLLSDKSSPLLNYATQYKAAPGSTFKIVTSTAGLLEGIINLKTTINCVSTYTNITPSPRCWSSYGHGNEVLWTAIRDSCNYYFYDVGYKLSTTTGIYNDAQGLNTLYEYADLYGLTEKSGVEISEYSPDVSTSDAVRSAIGQGSNSYTTAQLARYATTIATRGTCYDLTLLDHVTSASGNLLKTYNPVIRNTVDMPSEYWAAIQKGMRAVVQNKSYFSNLAVEVAGKTGTAEQTKSRPNHALFICYAPYDQPQIAMATRVPFGYSSDYAAQISRDIMKYYFGLVEEEELLTGTADTPDAGVTNEF